MQYGTATPAELVERAAEHGQQALALTDRDGLYGAIRFARAAARAGVAPVLGVDLALDPALDPGAASPFEQTAVNAATSRARGRTRTPVRGGTHVDPRHPRVTVLARGAGAGLPAGAGWGRLCRLVTATHLRGERGKPVTTRGLVAEHAALNEQAGLLVLLGPDSDVGRAVLAGRRDRARGLLQQWIDALPAGAVTVEIVDRLGAPGTPGNLVQARRMVALAREAGVPAVLSGAVRYLDPAGARTADVLDAARRLVLLDQRHLDRVSLAGHLATTEEMADTAQRVAGRDGAELLAQSVRIAEECALRPREDLGIGQVHLPEKEVLGLDPDSDAQAVLAERCRGSIAWRYPDASPRELARVEARLVQELDVIEALGYPTYFLTVAKVCDLIREMNVRVAARGSGAGSLVNHLLGISGVDPIRYDLLMERFCTPLRAELPDIDVDVESARREDVYRRVLDEFGGERVTCVSMMETYRVRHAIRDVGSALGLPPGEVDVLAKSFPHIRARDVQSALADLPELASLASARSEAGLGLLFELVESLDGLPRHVAMHPCGVILCNRTLLDRTPVEASSMGFPMSQFDKDDVEDAGLLKLDVLGIRMQSAMAHAVAEVARTGGPRIDLDNREQVDLEDPRTFELIRSTDTLGCFQIESPGQRELLGRFAPETFDDIVIDISLFRPGPIKSDMITPFLRARQGWSEIEYVHPSLEPALASTCGVVVFQEQVLRIIAVTTGASLAQADEVRRALGTTEGRERVEEWWNERAAERGYGPGDRERIWEVLAAFGSFGFCKAHAAAFALPTVQSAWLKAHHPAAFYAGVLTHDPGMYPKRLILADARRFGLTVAGIDVNASDVVYRVDRTAAEDPGDPGDPGDPDNNTGETPGAIRLSLMEIDGMSEAEAQRIVAGQPYVSFEDFWARAVPSRPIAEKLVLTGGFDALYGIGARAGSGLGGPGRRGAVTRRDLLLHVAELDRWARSTGRGSRSGRRRVRREGGGVREAAARQSQAAAPVVPAAQQPAQLVLDLGDAPQLTGGSGLPEMSRDEQVRAELEILGLDVAGHVVEPYTDLLDELGVVPSRSLLSVRSRSEVLVAGTKVATQTPPVRSGQRVVFCTLDDPTGPVDAAFFEDAQAEYAPTVFQSWLLLIRGVVRRTGPRGVSIRATGAWDLNEVRALWRTGGNDAVHRLVSAPSPGAGTDTAPRARRVLVHPTGYRVSPYADVRIPAHNVGAAARAGAVAPARPGVPGAPAAHGGSPQNSPNSSPVTRKLWHSSAGSSGW